MRTSRSGKLIVSAVVIWVALVTGFLVVPRALISAVPLLDGDIPARIYGPTIWTVLIVLVVAAVLGSARLNARTIRATLAVGFVSLTPVVAASALTLFIAWEVLGDRFAYLVGSGATLMAAGVLLLCAIEAAAIIAWVGSLGIVAGVADDRLT